MPVPGAGEPTYLQGVIRKYALVVVLVLTASACVSDRESSLEPPTTTAAPAIGAPEDVLKGDRLVVALGSGEVVVYDDTLDEIQRFNPDDGVVFKHPTWLDGSTVVFAELGDGGGPSALRAASVEDGSLVWRVELDTFPFYYLPSPPGTAAATTSLRNNPQGGLIAELIRGDGSVEQISDRSPFYSSWSPDGDALAIHERQARISVLDDGRLITVAEPSGAFQAPAWIEGGLVVLRATANGQTLSVWNYDSNFEDLAFIDGPVRFAATNDRIAIQSAEVVEGESVRAGLRSQTLPTIPGGRLAVVVIDSGSTFTVSNRLVPMFEWSRDGGRLLYASYGGSDSPEFTWRVWDTDSTTDLSSFVVQPEWFRDVAPFFDQYVQSVSLWSGSGDRIAYPATVDGTNAVVVEMADGSGTTTIPDAVWASWSPGEVP